MSFACPGILRSRVRYCCEREVRSFAHWTGLRIAAPRSATRASVASSVVPHCATQQFAMAAEHFTKANNQKGEFVRVASSFRENVTADGSSGFPAESGRYHLYVSLACPWASRCFMALKLKGLTKAIGVSVVHWFLDERGWAFRPGNYRCDADPVNGKEFLREIYALSEPGFSGRVTVPVLFDTTTKKIVNNESSEILRMLSTEFNACCETDEQRKLNFYPEHLRGKIDEWNDFVYPHINNGVYRAGFATTQEAYDKAVPDVFKGLDKLEEQLSKNRYLCGNEFTEADIRAFVTLIRFDMVYVGHFKCNLRRLIDYPNVWAYTRELYQMAGVSETVDRFHIEHHYQGSHRQINPHLIVAIGPELNLDEPHGRDKKFPNA